MTAQDARVDAYIAAAAPFAQPLLATLRERLHAASPTLVETIRWGMPTLLHDGRILAHFAAFKRHATLVFRDADAVGETATGAMGQFGRLTRPEELPDAATIAAIVQRSIARMAAPAPQRPRTVRAAPALPDVFATALRAQPDAQAGFDALAPGQRREYVEWIVEAKREDTRQRRIAQAVEWLAQGLPRDWKYRR
jgi:uncharacterized protein YdeI (YjbR/CyaY-like superfamily)